MKILARNFLCFSFLVSFACQDSIAKEVIDRKKNLLKADKIYYNTDTNYLEAVGNVRIVNGDAYLKTDKAIVDTENKRIWIDSDVYAENSKHKLFASSAYLDESKKEGIFSDVKFKISDSDFVTAKEMHRKDKNHYELYNSIYTPCTVCIKEKPLWQINSKKTKVDFEKEEIYYHHATLSVAGYKILYLPYFAHPLPKAKPRSGVLRPDRDLGMFRIPLYYYIKPNMDLTYTPRFNDKIFIHEGEFRHLISSGQYDVKVSYAKLPIKKQVNNQMIESHKKSERFHINSLGNFTNDHFHYGYKFDRVSDKSYLQNYYNNRSTYLQSDIHAYKIADTGYVYSDLQHYQGLRKADSSSTDPIVLPSVTLRKDTEFDNGLELYAKNSSMKYLEIVNKDVYRNNLELSLIKNFYGEYGQHANISFNNYLDAYHISKAPDITQIHPTTGKNLVTKNRGIVRDTPEFQTSARLPIFFSGSKNSIVLEPQTNLVVGTKKPNVNINKYKLIDSNNVDINENNIFENTRYSGSDFREYGTRFSYGINNYLVNEKWTISGFLGQLLKTQAESRDSKSNYVGKISFAYQENFEIYYRFQRKINGFEAERDEVSTYIDLGKFTNKTNVSFLKDLKQYPNYFDKQNSKKQIYSKNTFGLTENLTLFGDITLDLGKDQRRKILNDTIGISYKVDCISFSAKITSNYTTDPTRGITKNKSTTFSLGLKNIT